jgi:hypothetical protein
MTANELATAVGLDTNGDSAGDQAPETMTGDDRLFA